MTGAAAGWVKIVGLGPGADSLVTPEAQAVLAEATDVVGYIPYVARVADRPGLTKHASDNRVEIDRSQHALSMAAEGHRVAVVSSGDPGVFAMASAVFEAEAAPVYEKLLTDKHGARLCAMKKKVMMVEAHEITHDRFQPTPTWAQEKDLAATITHLTNAGIFRSEDELSDLLQQGRHRLFGNASQKGVFSK